jgi:hypothetical protein
LIQPAPTLSGDYVTRIPIRNVNGDGDPVQGTRYLQIGDGWTIDIQDSGINTSTRVGGRIDGVALAAQTDYLIWALTDTYNSDGVVFAGFGITTAPRVTGSSLSSGTGAAGTTATYSVTAGHGWRFTIGATAILRKGTASGSVYNQGAITAVTADSVTVSLDANYAANVNNNATVNGSGIEIFQVDRFEPRLQGSDSRYPGAGTEYQFAYVGMLQTGTTSSDVVEVRRPGERYRSHTRYTMSDITSGTSTNIATGIWMPAYCEPLLSMQHLSNGVTGVHNSVIRRLGSSATTWDAVVQIDCPTGTEQMFSDNFVAKGDANGAQFTLTRTNTGIRTIIFWMGWEGWEW